MWPCPPIDHTIDHIDVSNFKIQIKMFLPFAQYNKNERLSTADTEILVHALITSKMDSYYTGCQNP